MHSLVYHQHPKIQAWLEERLGRQPPGRTIAVLHNNEPVAVALFFNYTGNDVEVSIAGDPGWASKEVLKALFAYPFGQLNCLRMTARVLLSNVRAIKFVKRLGFVEEGRMRQAGPGREDILLFGILKDDNRWANHELPKTRHS